MGLNHYNAICCIRATNKIQVDFDVQKISSVCVGVRFVCAEMFDTKYHRYTRYRAGDVGPPAKTLVSGINSSDMDTAATNDSKKSGKQCVFHFFAAKLQNCYVIIEVW